MSSPDGPYKALADQVRDKREATRRDEELAAIATACMRLAERAEVLGESHLSMLLAEAAAWAMGRSRQ